MLFNGDGGRLPCGAHHADAAGALLHMPVNQFAQAGVIDPAIRKKRGYQGNNTAADCLHVGIFQHISATGVAA